jgi:hypothetical protein
VRRRRRRYENGSVMLIIPIFFLLAVWIRMDIGNNQLTGSIPPYIGRMFSLQRFGEFH